MADKPRIVFPARSIDLSTPGYIHPVDDHLYSLEVNAICRIEIQYSGDDLAAEI
jgi:hypothetical protein